MTPDLEGWRASPQVWPQASESLAWESQQEPPSDASPWVLGSQTLPACGLGISQPQRGITHTCDLRQGKK